MYKVSSDDTSLNAGLPNSGSRPSLSPYSFGAPDDPRSSSSQSLVPSPSERQDSGRRKLLVIYIHGFMGNDSSFQSFPAHVHRYLRLALSETHVVHSKIYPKYKTYKSINVACDNFSRWLSPHESPTTDIVLVGHSMGGLLAADVTLMPPRDRYSSSHFLHRILGTVHLDAPLLGLHPSVITAGIASLFRPKSDTAGPSEAPNPGDESSQSLSHVTSADTSIYSDPSSTSQQPSTSQGSVGTVPYGMTFDPNFNPSFANDVRLQDRGWWKNVIHFVEKHSSEGLFDAASYHIMSHLEFGGCLMDFNGLKTRYEKIRKLEDADDLKDHIFPHMPPQVRFVQYYTVCHGYPKKPKAGDPDRKPSVPGIPEEARSPPPESHMTLESHGSAPSTPNAAPEGSSPPQYTSCDEDDGSSLEILPPEPISEDVEPQSEMPSQSEGGNEDAPPAYSPPNGKPTPSENDTQAATQQSREMSLSQASTEETAVTANSITDEMASLSMDLPTVPDLPEKPEQPDLGQYTEKDARKQAEKESKQANKNYAKLVKNRDKAIKERQKIIDKAKKKMAQEAEKREKEERKRRQKEEKAAATSSSSNPIDSRDEASSSSTDADLDSIAMSPLPSLEEQAASNSKPPKQPKERKFCNLSHNEDGRVDSKWVKVFMKDMDQVAAHTSLFFRKEHYERFVCDVGETVVSWVQDDMTKRTILEME
ncbi:hypothetical protein GGR52DRAFT_584830 [Hypoxylon sp. FL1284]|nr:hypothetical protein GGR52DRAFT_584830 [Hypoxylon sp. FL1284]